MFPENISKQTVGIDVFITVVSQATLAVGCAVYSQVLFAVGSEHHGRQLLAGSVYLHCVSGVR